MDHIPNAQKKLIVIISISIAIIIFIILSILLYHKKCCNIHNCSIFKNKTVESEKLLDDQIIESSTQLNYKPSIKNESSSVSRYIKNKNTQLKRSQSQPSLSITEKIDHEKNKTFHSSQILFKKNDSSKNNNWSISYNAQIIEVNSIKNFEKLENDISLVVNALDENIKSKINKSAASYNSMLKTSNKKHTALENALMCEALGEDYNGPNNIKIISPFKLNEYHVLNFYIESIKNETNLFLYSAPFELCINIGIYSKKPIKDSKMNAINEANRILLDHSTEEIHSLNYMRCMICIITNCKSYVQISNVTDKLCIKKLPKDKSLTKNNILSTKNYDIKKYTSEYWCHINIFTKEAIQKIAFICAKIIYSDKNYTYYSNQLILIIINLPEIRRMHYLIHTKKKQLVTPVTTKGKKISKSKRSIEYPIIGDDDMVTKNDIISTNFIQQSIKNAIYKPKIEYYSIFNMKQEFLKHMKEEEEKEYEKKKTKQRFSYPEYRMLYTFLKLIKKELLPMIDNSIKKNTSEDLERMFQDQRILRMICDRFGNDMLQTEICKQNSTITQFDNDEPIKITPLVETNTIEVT